METSKFILQKDMLYVSIMNCHEVLLCCMLSKFSFWMEKYYSFKITENFYTLKHYFILNVLVYFETTLLSHCKIKVFYNKIIL